MKRTGFGGQVWLLPQTVAPNVPHSPRTKTATAFSAWCIMSSPRLRSWMRLHMDLPRRFQTVDLDRARFDPRNELAAELDRVVERVEAAKEKRIDAQSVVFYDRIGDLLGRSDETGRVAKGTGRACDRHPQALVMDVGLHGKVHQALARIVDGSSRLFLPAPTFLARHRCEDTVCLIPSRAFGGCNDGTNRDIESRHASEFCRLGAKLRHALAGRGERLGIDGIDVAPARAHGERARRSAAEEEERMRLLEGANIRSRAFDTIELPGEIERPLARPGELHQFEILRGAQIALAFRTEITVALLLIIGFASDDVHRQSSAGEVIEGGDLPRHQRRRDKTRPVRNEIAEPLGVGGGMERDQESLGRRR